MARSVSENMLDNKVGNDDYLKLSFGKSKERKIELYEYIKDGPTKGYLEMCRFCRGAEAINYPIVPAEQIEVQ